MPDFDGTGPDGDGSMTGCCGGNCENCPYDTDCSTNEADQDSEEDSEEKE